MAPNELFLLPYFFLIFFFSLLLMFLKRRIFLEEKHLVILSKKNLYSSVRLGKTSNPMAAEVLFGSAPHDPTFLVAIALITL